MASLSSGRAMTNSKTSENCWTRYRPRVAVPAAPTSPQKQWDKRFCPCPAHVGPVLCGFLVNTASH